MFIGNDVIFIPVEPVGTLVAAVVAAVTLAAEVIGTVVTVAGLVVAVAIPVTTKRTLF